MVGLITAVLIGMVYFLLISPQNEEKDRLVSETKSEQSKLDLMKKTIKQTQTTTNATVEIANKLHQEETDVASGDVFAWTYDTIRQFKANYPVDIPTIGQPAQSSVDLIPDFPYKQIKFSIMGTGFYHDIGKFVADLENKFPHMRVINLSLDHAGLSGTSSEKLAFRMEIVALVKSNS